jgi:hypothetical protein
MPGVTFSPPERAVLAPVQDVSRDPVPGLAPAAPEDAAGTDGPDTSDAAATLEAALDALGQAHHRPFSRG